MSEQNARPETPWTTTKLINELRAVMQEHGDVPCQLQDEACTTHELFFVVTEEYEDGWRVNIRLWTLPEVERERLLKGNWKIRPAAGKLFNRAWFIPSIDKVPPLGVECRFWDLAASTKKGADYTVGVKIRRVRDTYFITDMIKVQMGPAEVDLLASVHTLTRQSARGRA